MSANDNGEKKEPTSTQDWKKPQGIAVDMPSGNVALLRPASIDTFMQMGIIPNSLLQLLIGAAKKGEINKGKLTQELLAGLDEEKIDEIFGLYNAVTIYCCVAPKVFRVPNWTKKHHEEGMCSVEEVGTKIPIDQRDNEKLYVDEVDLDDKAYIFHWAIGGVRDLDNFREQLAHPLGALLTGEDLELPAEQPVGDSG